MYRSLLCSMFTVSTIIEYLFVCVRLPLLLFWNWRCAHTSGHCIWSAWVDLNKVTRILKRTSVWNYTRKAGARRWTNTVWYSQKCETIFAWILLKTFVMMGYDLASLIVVESAYIQKCILSMRIWENFVCVYASKSKWTEQQSLSSHQM